MAPVIGDSKGVVRETSPGLLRGPPFHKLRPLPETYVSVSHRGEQPRARQTGGWAPGPV